MVSFVSVFPLLVQVWAPSPADKWDYNSLVGRVEISPQWVTHLFVRPLIFGAPFHPSEWNPIYLVRPLIFGVPPHNLFHPPFIHKDHDRIGSGPTFGRFWSMRRTRSMVWSLSPSLDVKRFWPTESLTAQAIEKTTSVESRVGCCIYRKYIVSLNKNSQNLVPAAWNLLFLDLFFAGSFSSKSNRFRLIEAWDWSPETLRRCGRGSPCWLSIFRHWRQSILGCDDSCAARQDARIGCRVDKIWCTSLYGEHIHHEAKTVEVFFSILAGSRQIFAHICQQKTSLSFFFLGNYVFSVNFYVFLVFLELVEP